MSRFQWAEDDFDLPSGVIRLDVPEPVSGKRYIMYHGTTSMNAQPILTSGFRQSEDGILVHGIYLSRDLEKASHYPIGHPEYDRFVTRVAVDVGNVNIINHQGHPRQKNWLDSRYGPLYDTAWVLPVYGMVKSNLGRTKI